MKKMVLFVAAAFAASVLGASAQVYSQNAVGYTKITLPAGGNFQLVAMNYNQVGGGGKTLSEIFGPGTLAWSFLPNSADQVFLFRETATPGVYDYITYYKSNDTTWQRADAAFDDPVIPSGEGFWIKTASAGVERSIYIHGEASLAPTAQKNLGIPFSLICHDYATDLDMNAATTVLTGATSSFLPGSADNISVLNAAGDYDQYYLNALGSWQKSGGAVGCVIPVGAGCWYEAKNPPVTIDLTRPFTYP